MKNLIRNLVVVLALMPFIKGSLSAKTFPPAKLEVSATTHQTGNGYEYNYLLKNTGTKAVVQFSVLTPEKLAGSGQMPIIKECWVPAGWTGQASTMGDHITTVTWASTGNPGSDLVPGAEIGGFGFLSDASSGKADFTMMDSSMDQYQGKTTGPAVGTGTGAKDGTANGNILCSPRPANR